MAIDAALARLMDGDAPYDAGRALLNFSREATTARAASSTATRCTSCAPSRTGWTAATCSPPTTRSRVA